MAVVFSFAGAAGCVATLLHDAAMNPAEGNDSSPFPSMGSYIYISGLFLYFWFAGESQGAPHQFWWEILACYIVLPLEGTPSMLSVLRRIPLDRKHIQ